MDLQHIPTESSGPFRGLQVIPHQLVTKIYRGLETPPPPGGRRLTQPLVFPLCDVHVGDLADHPLPTNERAGLWRPLSVSRTLGMAVRCGGPLASRVRLVWPSIPLPSRYLLHLGWCSVARRLDCLPPLETVRDHYACPLRGRRLDRRGSTALRPFL